MIRVRDIIKFGRVNFKISALNCDRIDQLYTGSCYQPPSPRANKSAMEIDDNISGMKSPVDTDNDVHGVNLNNANNLNNRS